MNGKKAKLLRKVGKVDKATKRNYNKLNHSEKNILTHFYNFSLDRAEADKSKS